MIFAQIFFFMSMTMGLLGLFYQFSENLRQKWIIRSKNLSTFLKNNEFYIDKYAFSSDKWGDFQVTILVSCFTSLFYRNIIHFAIDINPEIFDLKKLSLLSNEVEEYEGEETDAIEYILHWKYKFWFILPDTKTFERDFEKRFNILMRCKIEGGKT